MTDLNLFLQVLSGRLKPFRVDHSVRVAETASELANLWGADAERAYLAGLLHDYARDESAKDLIDVAESRGLTVTDVDRFFPVLLHAPVGAVLVREKLEVSDPQVLQAIASHTTGAPVMSLLDKIIYLADMVEPGRRYPGVEYIRRACYVDLHRALLAGMDSTLRYCLDQERPVHPVTIAARNNFLLEKLDGGR